jgi:mevalonate kinase
MVNDHPSPITLSPVTPMTTTTAPGKIILVGEHAVVYGRPAIAVPVWQVTATATISSAPWGAGCTIRARDIGLTLRLRDAGDDQPLALVTRLAMNKAGLTSEPDWLIELHSEIPIASGLGSGAAISTALVRAIFAHAGQPITAEQVSDLVYESERFYHGTPSGIDNTVIAHAAPIWFVKGRAPIPFAAARPFTLIIADSGIQSPTKETVGDVRRAWLADTPTYERWFDEIAVIVHDARVAIEQGNLPRLGKLFDLNQELLVRLGVSSPPLQQLVAGARAAGALGAKLSGGGRGGNVIALVNEDRASAVAVAFLSAGAARVIETTVERIPINQ